MVQFCSQLEAMQNMKEQLEQRTKMIEANIQRQQDELRQIQEELQRVQGQSLQVRPSRRRRAVFSCPSLSGRVLAQPRFVSESASLLSVADVLAERSWRTESELCSDGPGERSAAGGDLQRAGPLGVPGTPAEHHAAATHSPASVPAANTPPGAERGARAGQTSRTLLPFPSVRRIPDAAAAFHSGSVCCSLSGRLSLCSHSKIRFPHLSTTP